MGHADADAQVEFPVGREVEIDGGQNLLLLFAQGVEAGDWAERSVILQPAGDFRGEIVTCLEVGRKLDALADAGAVERPVERRVERPIPLAALLIDDGPDLPGPGVSGKNGPLIPDFGRKAQPNRPFPLLRDAYPWADVVANPLPSLAWSGTREHVPAGLEPVIKAVRNFERF